MSPDNFTDRLKTILDRVEVGAHTEADILELRRALAAQKITIAEGDGAVSIGGDANRSVIITGSNNFVYVLNNTPFELIGYIPRPALNGEIELERLGVEFVSQLRIAAHFQDDQNRQRPVYLDGGLYVHRSEAEKQVLDETRIFLESESPQGKWISIVGSAGRGKSSSLWFLFQHLKSDPRAIVIPIQAQFLIDQADREIKEIVQRVTAGNTSRRSIVLIDTLDILVGVNDRALSQTLNALRSLGCLLISASRRQEAEQLYSLVNRDCPVELHRYTDEEFTTITRLYVDEAYPGWGNEQKKQQLNKVTGLLEQRRDARELDLEPLILRMIFEVYAPNDIPQDINTQKVYERFWEERVLRDRHRSALQQFARDQICRLLARLIVFGGETGHSDTLSLSKLRSAWPEGEFSLDTLEGLVSSGVLQWAIGKQAVRFFHQTFFEYAAAYDIRCADSHAEKDGKIASLLAYVSANDLFHAPVLKQIAIQDYYHEQVVWQRIIVRLRETGNLLAARLLIEIIGKIEETEFCLGVCDEWIRADERIFGAVVVETVRHYPKKRIRLALQILKPFLRTEQQTSIFTLCQDSFAILDPEAVLQFLRGHLDVARKGDKEVRTFYKDALCATFRYGAWDALDDLAALFRSLEMGQQAGLLENLSEAVTAENSEQIVSFLSGKMYALLADSNHLSKVWKAFSQLFLKAHELSPQIAEKHLRSILDQKKWRQDRRQAQFIGSLIGHLLVDEAMIRQSLSDLQSDDHTDRLVAAEILYEASPQFTDLILDHVLAINVAPGKEKDLLPSLFRVVAGRRHAEQAKVIRFLERWGCPQGVGDPLREIIANLANNAPTLSKEWLLGKLAGGERNYLVFFAHLVQTNVQLFTEKELSEVHRIALNSTSESLRLFSGVIGCFAEVDEGLTERIFFGIFRQKNVDLHQAAIGSLNFCLKLHPALVLRQAEAIFDLAARSGRVAYLQQLFSVLKQFPQESGADLLNCLSRFSEKPFFNNIQSDAVLTELAAALKVAIGQNPRLALHISKQLPPEIASVAKAQASIYMNIAQKCDDLAILTEALAGFGEILQVKDLYGSKIRNALGNALPLLDHKLGGRNVVELILAVCQKVGHERSLEDLMRAAIRVPSLTEADISTMLKLDLPESARGILLQKRKASVV
jgi:hypothetical protein